MPFNVTSDLINAAMNESSLELNCTMFYSQVLLSYKPILLILNKINYTIISMGIMFNLLNLYVLLNSKLNESPYTYLTILAISDLGALLMICVNKLAEMWSSKDLLKIVHLYIVTPAINVFLSCSMYITLALTIERFIFVHSPFKAILICRKSIARRVCVFIFIFSFVRTIYLPFTYKKNSCMENAFDQKKIKALDIYEFLISLAVPYSIIFVANISLIWSLTKKNTLIDVPVSPLYAPNGGGGGSAKSSSLSSKRRRNTTLSMIGNKRKASDELENRHVKNKRTQFDEPVPNKHLQLNQNESTSVAVDKRILKKDSLIVKPIIDCSTAEVPVKKYRHSHSLSFVRDVTSFGKKRSLPQSSTQSAPAIRSFSLYHRTSNQREMKNQKKLTISLIIILCLLLICYLPAFLFEESLADIIFGDHLLGTEESKRALKIKSIGHRISLILILTNCSANFLIYCISNKKFNNSLKILVRNSYFYRLIGRIAQQLSISKENFLSSTCGRPASQSTIHELDDRSSNLKNLACCSFQNRHDKQQNQMLNDPLAQTLHHKLTKVKKEMDRDKKRTRQFSGTSCQSFINRKRSSIKEERPVQHQSSRESIFKSNADAFKLDNKQYIFIENLNGTII